MIRTLDPKQNQGSGPEVQALKNQLQEKERMLHTLEVFILSPQLYYRTVDLLDGLVLFMFSPQTERNGQDQDPEGL